MSRLEAALRAQLHRGAAAFQAWDQARETLLRDARELVRVSGSLIRDLHAGRAAAPAWASADRLVRRLLSMTRRHAAFRHAGAIQTALGEYCEARLLQAAITGHPPHRLVAAVPADPLLLGIADTIGELRRRLLDRLAHGDTGAAAQAYDQMESLFGLLSGVEPPEALVALRPKRDAARGILERSRGDIVSAKRQKHLEKKIDDLASLLDEAEGRPAKKAKAAPSEDLDIDAAWTRS